MIEFGRRRFLSGLVGLVAAPAIVRVSSLMPVKAPVPMTLLEQFDLLDDRLWRISSPPLVVSNPTQFNVKDFFPWADTMADVIRPGIFPGCEPPDGFPRQICGAAADGLTTGSGDLDYRHYP